MEGAELECGMVSGTEFDLSVGYCYYVSYWSVSNRSDSSSFSILISSLNYARSSYGWVSSDIS